MLTTHLDVSIGVASAIDMAVLLDALLANQIVEQTLQIATQYVLPLSSVTRCVVPAVDNVLLRGSTVNVQAVLQRNVARQFGNHLNDLDRVFREVNLLQLSRVASAIVASLMTILRREVLVEVAQHLLTTTLVDVVAVSRHPVEILELLFLLMRVG